MDSANLACAIQMLGNAGACLFLRIQFVCAWTESSYIPGEIKNAKPHILLATAFQRIERNEIVRLITLKSLVFQKSITSRMNLGSITFTKPCLLDFRVGKHLPLNHGTSSTSIPQTAHIVPPKFSLFATIEVDGLWSKFPV